MRSKKVHCTNLVFPLFISLLFSSSLFGQTQFYIDVDNILVRSNFQFLGAGAFRINNGGIDGGRFYVGQNGNVGIGTNAPTSRLTVVSPTNTLGFTHTDGVVKIGTAITPNSAYIGTYSNHPLYFVTNNGIPQMTLGTNGNVGIGIGASVPNEKLTVFYSGYNLGLCQTDGNIKMGTQIYGGTANIGTYSNHALYFMANNSTKMVITTNGNVGIGTHNPGTYKLAVEGTIGARSIEVKLTSWADFVFDKNYKLRPLKEVADSIHANKRLPGVPSEEQVKKDGINVGNMTTILLQKIEELTLYAIEQDKSAMEQDKRMEAIEKENALLKEKLNQQ